MKKQINSKILLIQFGGIGDVLLSFPAFHLLEDNYKEIYFIGLQRTLSLVQAYFHNFKLLCFPFDPFRYNLINTFRFFKFLIEVGKLRIDIAFNLQPITNFRASLPIYFIMSRSKARIKVGRNTNGWGWFFNHKIAENLKGRKFEGEYNLELVEMITGKQGKRDFQIDLNDEIKKRMAKYKFPEGNKIGICMGGKLAEQQWSNGNFSEIIKRILNKTNYHIMLVGEEYEKSQYHQKNDRIWDYRGKTDVLDLVAVISQVDIFISNDTAPMHIACALGKKVIALFRNYTYGHFSWKRDGICNFASEKVKDIPVDDVWNKALNCFS